MSSPIEVLKSISGYLKGTAAFPMSLLLIGLEELIKVEFFKCPCRVNLNALLTAAIFSGPALFIFTLMFLFLRPFKYECSRCCCGANDDTKPNWPKAFAHCLVPPVIWVFILLLSGEYVLCGMTYWKGVYMFDNELKSSWCKPTERIQNETELRNLARQYIHQSQYSGYVLISVFSAFTIVFVGVYDCCMSGKCDCCPSQLLSSCRRTAVTQNERQNNGEE